MNTYTFMSKKFKEIKLTFLLADSLTPSLICSHFGHKQPPQLHLRLQLELLSDKERQGVNSVPKMDINYKGLQVNYTSDLFSCMFFPLWTIYSPMSRVRLKVEFFSVAFLFLALSLYTSSILFFHFFVPLITMFITKCLNSSVT